MDMVMQFCISMLGYNNNNNNNNSILYYLCAVSTAVRPITDTAQCTRNYIVEHCDARGKLPTRTEEYTAEYKNVN
jgi:hypothetical protein